MPIISVGLIGIKNRLSGYVANDALFKSSISHTDPTATPQVQATVSMPL